MLELKESKGKAFHELAAEIEKRYSKKNIP